MCHKLGIGSEKGSAGAVRSVAKPRNLVEVRSEKHPAVWEKKGSSLYTVTNVDCYPELRTFTNWLLNRIKRVRGFVSYVGIRKTAKPEAHDANALYSRMLREAIRRIDAFCREDCEPSARFLLALNEHPRRAELLTAAARDMYGGDPPRRQLVEPPFHLERHRYQTVQAADWIAATPPGRHKS